LFTKRSSFFSSPNQDFPYRRGVFLIYQGKSLVSRPGNKRKTAAPNHAKTGGRKAKRMHQIVIDAPAGQVSAELTRRGVAAEAKVHVIVEFPDDGDLSMGAISEAGRAQDWLTEEPELYSDADRVERAA
jgi:hypothetical protein